MGLKGMREEHALPALPILPMSAPNTNNVMGMHNSQPARLSPPLAKWNQGQDLQLSRFLGSGTTSELQLTTALEVNKMESGDSVVRCVTEAPQPMATQDHAIWEGVMRKNSAQRSIPSRS